MTAEKRKAKPPGNPTVCSRSCLGGLLFVQQVETRAFSAGIWNNAGKGKRCLKSKGNNKNPMRFGEKKNKNKAALKTALFHTNLM